VAWQGLERRGQSRRRRRRRVRGVRPLDRTPCREPRRLDSRAPRRPAWAERQGAGAAWPVGRPARRRGRGCGPRSGGRDVSLRVPSARCPFGKHAQGRAAPRAARGRGAAAAEAGRGAGRRAGVTFLPLRVARSEQQENSRRSLRAEVLLAGGRRVRIGHLTVEQLAAVVDALEAGARC
jgi:hypothetical protein